MRESLLAFVVFAGCLLTASATQTNLVSNAGFEEPSPSADHIAGGWWVYQNTGETSARVDFTNARSGSASVKLHSPAPAKSVLVSAPFPVTGGDELKFEVWTRAGNPQTVQAGLAFRDADNKVFKRSFFSTPASAASWSSISGSATAPDGAVSAEVHLGYTNAPAPVWFDDARVVISSPVSFTLVQGAKPWAGSQNILVSVANRQASTFRGTITTVVARRTENLSVSLEPGLTRQFAIPITLNGVSAHPYKISLLDSTGASLRVIEGKFQTKPPLILYPPCPCYHAVGEGNGDTRVDARVNLSPDQRAGLKFKVNVEDASGKDIQSAASSVSTNDGVGVNVRIPVNAPGAFGVTAQLLDAAGKELASARSEIRVCAAKDARVTIATNGFLIVDGKPNFPIGMYSSGHDEEMGRAGFTATHNYGITTGEAADAINVNDRQLLDLLDKSWANGMRMMVELPRKPIEKAQWQQIRRRVETFRHHPGLLCWGSEERVARGAAPLANIVALYRLVHELDPNHPFVLGDTRDVIQKLQVDRRNFFPDEAMDIGIWWWYPIPLKEPDANGLSGGQRVAGVLEPPPWLTTTTSKKPLWLAFQAYQKPSKDARYPTPAEYRCQAYLSIINGAKGIWFYTGSGQKDYDGKPSGLLNKLEQSHWDYVQTLAHELREFSPVIMAPAGLWNITLLPTNAPIQFVTRELDGKTYLIAANRSEHPQSAKFSGELFKDKHARVLYETGSATIAGDSLADEFVPLGVHVYRIE